MKQQWIPKSTEETGSNHGSEVTQEVGDSSPQTKLLRMNWSYTHQGHHKEFQ